jgi:formamidopyrimidine-DNA glycosylase
MLVSLIIPVYSLNLIMPELPEVETVMRGLDAALTGQIIARAALTRSDLRWPVPDGLVQALTGARVVGFRRRGKYILLRLDRGFSLLIHLGMSGRMTIDQAPQPHQHLTLRTASGRQIGFVDPRRFGALDLVATNAEDQHWLLAKLGPEPLEPALTPAYLARALAGKSSAIKILLLDQALIAGIGNIYASEALHRAGINPTTQSGKLSRKRLTTLIAAIRETLTDAIAAGGSSLRDYAQPSGELGYFQHAWRVYDRAGEPCAQCPGPPRCPGITRIVQSNRATYYCPFSQP